MVDNRPMKIEIVVDPTKVSLADRIGAPPKPTKPTTARDPKARPKAVTAGPKSAVNNNRSGQKGAQRNDRSGKRAGSGFKKTPKTSEQLDLEMDDYFRPNENGARAAAPDPVPTAADTAAMEDL